MLTPFTKNSPNCQYPIYQEITSLPDFFYMDIVNNKRDVSQGPELLSSDPVFVGSVILHQM
jgi:hypothetical protein